MNAAPVKLHVPIATDEELAQISSLGVSRESLERIELFLSLLVEWQERMNLVSSSTWPNLWKRHVLDSLQLLPHLGAPSGRIADLGSGGGFPGLILAIATGRAVDFFESNQKKAAFLTQALRATGSRGEVNAIRIENVRPPPAGRYSHVTARALAPLPVLLELASPFLQAHAIGLFLKGKDVQTELTASAKSWKIKADRFQSLTDSEAVLLVVREALRV